MKSLKFMHFIFILSAVIVLFLDQLTKYWIKATIPVSSSMEVIPRFLYITHVRNPGAAFGLFQDGTTILAIISFVAVFLIVFIKFLLRIKSYFFNISLGLIMGGALGNLIDRLVLGEVTDFIHFLYWPVFNIADSSIVIGFGIAILLLFKEFFKKNSKMIN